MLVLRVEADAGSIVDDVAKSMVQLVCNLGVGVVCMFNGVELYAFPGLKWAAIVRQYEDEFSALQHPKKAKGGL